MCYKYQLSGRPVPYENPVPFPGWFREKPNVLPTDSYLGTAGHPGISWEIIVGSP